jgi:hypothetical protein
MEFRYHKTCRFDTNYSSLIHSFPNIIQIMQTQMVETDSHNTLRVNASGLEHSVALKPVETVYRMAHSCQTQRRLGRWRSGYAAFFGFAWDFTLYKSQQGWQFSMSSYTTVALDSPVAEYVKAGNIPALQQLFANGEASPFTICVLPGLPPELAGYTLLR